MKIILGIIVFILVAGLAAFLLPAVIGILIGVMMISNGSVIGGIIAIAAGILINIAMVYGSYLEGNTGGGHLHDDCPYCGSGDTDGNHCYNCDEDF